MPASLFIVPAVVIGLIAWIMAYWHTRKSKADSPRDELERLRNHASWLEQRLDTARRERWDPDMIISLSDQLGAACHALALAQRRKRPRTLASH